MKNYLKYLPFLALGVISCEPELDNPVDEIGFYSNGEADFSNYVALGNSITAGYADGALYITGQENSYPNIMAQQFARVQETNGFTQPLMADNAGGLLFAGTQFRDNRRVLAFGSDGSPAPRIYAGMQPTTDITNVLSGSFNNMGVPGVKSFHLSADGYGDVSGFQVGTSNPYFVRFASSPNTSVLADAAAQNPTFFSVFIGSNDIFFYASEGGVGEDQTGNRDPRTYGPNDITDPTVFASAYSNIVDAMVATGADGALINLPNVTSIPFFTTVPFNPLTKVSLGSGDEAIGIETINDLNTRLYGPLNAALTKFGAGDRISLLSTTADNPLLIKDESLADLSAQLTAAFTPILGEQTATFYGNVFGQARQAKASDLVLLTTSSVIGSAPEGIPAPLDKFGITYPLQDKHVLIPTEIMEIETAQASYNATIKTLAQANGLAFVDLQAALAQVANGGIPFDGGVVTSQFVTGGTFSLDGAHPTPRGSALIANTVLDAINATYNSTVPKVNIGAYGTVTLSNDVQ